MTSPNFIRLVDKIGRQRDAFGAANRHDLAHQTVKEGARIRVLKDRPERLAGRCGRAGQSDQEDEFLPALAVDRVRQRDVDPRRLGGVGEGLEPRIGLPVDTPADHARERAGVSDDPRRGQHRSDIGAAGDHSIRAEDRRKPLRAVDTILQCDHTGVRPEQRESLLGRLLGIPQLDREQHDIDRPEL